MKKRLIILTLLVAGLATLSFGAKLPSSGYSGPYRAPDDGLDWNDPNNPYIYGDWDNLNSGGQSKFRTLDVPADLTACDELSFLTNSTEGMYCSDCINAAAAAYATGNCSAAEDAFYECQLSIANGSSTCADGGGTTEPPPLPIGSSLCLLLFAPLYGVFAFWRKKKSLSRK